MTRLKLFFFTAFAVLLGWTTFLTVRVTTEPTVIVAIRGYDPVDLLSGHFLRYEFDWGQTDCAQFEQHRCPIYEFDRKVVRRFYVPEKDVSRLDKVFNSGVHQFEIMFSYRKGRTPIAMDLLIDGQKWSKFLK